MGQITADHSAIQDITPTRKRTQRSSTSQRDRRSRPVGLGVILAGSTVMYLILHGGLTLWPSSIDNTVGRIIITAVMVAVALVIERRAFGRGLCAALRALGYGWPRPRAVVVALAVSALMLAYFPVVSLTIGTTLRPERDWLWLLVGAVALNGIGEETLFRGFVFGHLRAGGRTFLRAGLISLVIFAAVHLVLFVNNPPTIALMSVVVAVAWAFPLAYLFERGGSTIWATVILHAATHAVRFFDDPSPLLLAGWLILQTAAPFLVFLFRGYLAQPARPRTRRSRRVKPAGERPALLP
jgi:hypothetical protein